LICVLVGTIDSDNSRINSHFWKYLIFAISTGVLRQLCWRIAS
jgi:hypothetical protein